MPKLYDVVAITGEYTGRDGQPKKKYMNCGAVFEKEGRLSLKLEGLPIEFNGWLSLYEPKSSQQTAQQGVQQAHQAIDPTMNDDLPW